MWMRGELERECILPSMAPRQHMPSKATASRTAEPQLQDLAVTGPQAGRVHNFLQLENPTLKTPVSRLAPDELVHWRGAAQSVQTVNQVGEPHNDLPC